MSRARRVESIAYQVRDVFDAMREDAGAPSALLADGGASRNDALMQFQADMLGCPVDPQRFRRPVGARRRMARGSGGRASGRDSTRWRSCPDDRSRFEPAMSRRAERDARYAGWRDAVQRRAQRGLRPGALT